MSTPSPTPAVQEQPPIETPSEAPASPKVNAEGSIPVVEMPKEAPRRLKVKVNGNEQEIEEAELVRDYQLKQASYAKMQEAAEMKTKLMEIIQILKTDPKRALSHEMVGVDVRKFAEQILAEQLEEDLMDDKDKALRAKERELEEFRQREAKQKEAERLQAEEAEMQRHFETYKNLVNKAVALTGTPGSKTLYNRMITYLQAAEHSDILPSPEELAQAVMEEDRGYFSAVSKDLPMEKLAALLGEDTLKALRKWDSERIGKQVAKSQETGEKRPAKKTSKKGHSWDEMMETLRDKYK